MGLKKLFNKVNKNIDKLSGGINEFDLISYKKILAEINDLEKNYAKKTESELKYLSAVLSKRAISGENLNNILFEAYALVREVCKRLLNMRPYDVQVIAAIVLHQAKLAEMKTGEGKTLAAVMPAYLNSLTEEGVHILTFNDYLAKRDAEWMRPVYEFLGLSVGFVQEKSTREERLKAYNSAITYSTAKEVGFDYLRSFICYEKEELVLRPFNYVIIDEADALLIDEARNPLVLAGNIFNTEIDLYELVDFVSGFRLGLDCLTDDNYRNIFLIENGFDKVEKKYSIENLFDKKNNELHSAINLALHANFLLHKDIDYIIRGGKIKLLDEFTGRIVKDRKWQHGLHMAVEAKEKIQIRDEGSILGSIPIQYFIKLYPKISGMTATAMEAANEFNGFYNLKIVVIPPNVESNKTEYPNLIFTHKEAKINAIVNEIKNIHKSGRPVLIGTHTVKESEELYKVLIRNNIEANILNAKNDELEAEIIANAGTLNAVTISTNMAGRGTDIILGGVNEKNKDIIKALGGLHVIATNRHESKRIDNQLKGRAGRQGDPGSSRFITSFEDELMVKYKLKEILPEKYRNINQNEAIDIPVISRRIEQAQRIIEGQMFEIRKTLDEYTTLIEKQRIFFQQCRQRILFDEDFSDYSLIFEKYNIKKVDRKLKYYILNQYDKCWAKHLDYASELREGIHLLRLGGESPIRKFQKKTDQHFRSLQSEIDETLIGVLNDKNLNLNKLAIDKPSTTWTYIVNDNPFKNQFAIKLLAGAFFGSCRT
ncbi:DEAD/DEAH box helicase [Bacteroidota bacterium]